ncbi:MAG: dihydrolipoyl dehydrogenase [Methylotenera sp.]|nr:dihydrolipoyl dehydrogenase [Oligoflexia bacterium]
MRDPLDVIIIGAGTAGLSALREVKKRTQHFVVINDGPWGTMCARVGCMPSKALIAVANAFHTRHAFQEFGISGGNDLSIDVPAVLRRVRALRDDFVAGNLDATVGLGERAISGRARLLGMDRVSVNGKELRARRIIIATGSTPALPKSWLPLGERLLTTDTLFEQQTLPNRIAVVGQGALGVGLAQALCRLGLDVVAIGDSQSVAGLTDPLVNAVAIEVLRREFPVHVGDKAELSSEGAGVRVRAGRLNTVVDRVLVALGRRPNIEGLGLDALGVALDSDGVPKVDARTMQVGGLPIFLVGDANGETAVLHEASDDGHIAGLNATAESFECFQRRTPLAIVFSEPNVAMVGKRFTELDASQVLIGEVRFEDQGRARIAHRNIGILRVYADRHIGLLLGAELCAPAGEHLALLMALAIERALTVSDLLRMPFYHPVFEEGLRTALRQLSAQLPASKDSDLARCTK